MRAQLALQAGRVDDAAAAARAPRTPPAAPPATAPSSRTPCASSAFTALRSGDAAAARAQLEQALALDREIGASRKIAFDLLALGRAAALGGDRDGARAYYARALAVSEADRDDAAAAEARALLDSVSTRQRPGKSAAFGLSSNAAGK